MISTVHYHLPMYHLAGNTAQISVSVQFNSSSHCIASVIVGLLIVLIESNLFFRVEKNFLRGILLVSDDNAMDEIFPNDSYTDCSESVLSILPHRFNLG